MWGHMEMKNKQNITLYLDREVIEKARELGLNISKVCENALIQAIKALESIFTEKGGNLGTVGSGVAGPGGIEPPTYGSPQPRDPKSLNPASDT